MHHTKKGTKLFNLSFIRAHELLGEVKVITR